MNYDKWVVITALCAMICILIGFTEGAHRYRVLLSWATASSLILMVAFMICALVNGL